jgi:hypothetical protein
MALSEIEFPHSSQKQVLSPRTIVPYWLSIFATLVPAAYVLYLALNAGDLPRNDYWSVLSRIYSINGFSTHLSDWLSRQNEHVMLISYLIYALNIVAMRGSNIGLTLATWLFGVVQLLLLIALLPHDEKDRSIVSVALIPCIAAFVFTPSAAHNWILGFSGVAWIGANMFVVGSIFCLARFSRDKHLAWAVCSLLLGLMAALTYTTSLALWPVLCLGLVLVRSRLPLIGLALALTGAVYFGFFFGYKALAGHPAPVYTDLYPLLYYTVIYLGSPFTTQAELAAAIGAAGLVASTIIFIVFLLQRSRETRSSLLPWVLLQFYAIGTSAMIAVGRSGFGATQAIASRYASLPALFWIGLLVTAMLCFQQSYSGRPWSRRALVLAGLMTALLILSMYRVGFSYAQTLFRQVSFQPLVRLSVQLGIPDEQIIQLSITPYPGQFLRNLPALDAGGHVPFNRKASSCGEVDQPFDLAMVNSASQLDLRGYFDFVDQFGDKGTRAVGWAYDPHGHVRCVVLVDRHGIVRGLGVSGFKRPDVAQVLGLSDPYTGWVGYVPAPPRDEELVAYVLPHNDPHWVALENSHLFGASNDVKLAIYRSMVE